MKAIAASAAFLGLTNPDPVFFPRASASEKPLGFSSGYGSGEHCVRFAFALFFFFVFQRLAALSLAFCFLIAAFLRSFCSLFCVHSLRRPSNFQKAINVSRFFSHWRGDIPAIFAKKFSSFGKEHDGRNHASINNRRYAPCCSVVRWRVLVR